MSFKRFERSIRTILGIYFTSSLAYDAHFSLPLLYIPSPKKPFHPKHLLAALWVFTFQNVRCALVMCWWKWAKESKTCALATWSVDDSSFGYFMTDFKFLPAVTSTFYPCPLPNTMRSVITMMRTSYKSCTERHFILSGSWVTLDSRSRPRMDHGISLCNYAWIFPNKINVIATKTHTCTHFHLLFTLHIFKVLVGSQQ